MFTLHIFLLLFCLNAYTNTQDIQVIGSGVVALRRNDMIVVFYVTIRHFGKKARRAMATPVECCETVVDGDNDCDLIDLFGGDFGIIPPGAIANITFLFPSMYGYNRKGSCVVKILHRDLGRADVVEMHHRIEFDTTLTAETTTAALKELYDPASFEKCDTPDLDPLDRCNPVDCRLKYGGYRNYYNRKTRMCQRVPVCSTNLTKELPDVVYMPHSNACCDLEKAVSKEDIEMLTREKYVTPSERMVNIRCHHGEIDPRTGLCICDPGWKSEPFNPDVLPPGASFSMCNIQCREDSRLLAPVVGGFVLGLWCLLLVLMCEWHDVFLRRNRRTGTEFREIYTCPDNPCDLHTIELSSTSNSVVGSAKNSR